MHSFGLHEYLVFMIQRSITPDHVLDVGLGRRHLTAADVGLTS